MGKIIIYLALLISTAGYGKYTQVKTMIVSKYFFDEAKKSVLVNFKNNRGDFKGKPRDLECFRYSFENKVSVKIEFVAANRGIIDCVKD